MNYFVRTIDKFPYNQFSVRSLKRLCTHVCTQPDNNLIYDRQFGFRCKHSTNHALINITEDIKSYMDRGYIAAGVFIDLQKAFDTVNHQILCDKLAYYGFRGKSLNLIKSFLNNRKQFVSMNGFGSSKLNITCGVPQGSTLGPLLLLIYLNDLRFC